jgi:predicted nucleic acid-binding protein
VTLYYADTSAIIRAYFVDEDDHESLQELIFAGDDPVVTSEVTRVELASATVAAHRSGRIPEPTAILDLFDLDCRDEGAVALLRFDPEVVLPLARRLVTEHPLRTLDAIHLAVALGTATQLAAGEPVAILTRDKRQAAVATALGLPVR